MKMREKPPRRHFEKRFGASRASPLASQTTRTPPMVHRVSVRAECTLPGRSPGWHAAVGPVVAVLEESQMSWWHLPSQPTKETPSPLAFSDRERSVSRMCA